MYFINKGSYLVTFSLANCLIHLAESKRIGYLAESNIKRIGHLDESKWIGRLASEDDMINVGYGLNNGKYAPPPPPRLFAWLHPSLQVLLSPKTEVGQNNFFITHCLDIFLILDADIRLYFRYQM